MQSGSGRIGERTERKLRRLGFPGQSKCWEVYRHTQSSFLWRRVMGKCTRSHRMCPQTQDTSTAILPGQAPRQLCGPRTALNVLMCVQTPAPHTVSSSSLAEHPMTLYSLCGYIGFLLPGQHSRQEGVREELQTPGVRLWEVPPVPQSKYKEKMQCFPHCRHDDLRNGNFSFIGIIRLFGSWETLFFLLVLFLWLVVFCLLGFFVVFFLNYEGVLNKSTAKPRIEKQLPF